MSKIDVCGMPWELVSFTDSSRADGTMGRCDSKKCTIHLSEELEDTAYISTLNHEYIHAVLDYYGVDHSEYAVNVIANELTRIGFEPEEWPEDILGEPSPESRSKK